mgnify:FL=1
MGISKITRNCQITLPKDVRKIIDVKEGDEVMFIVDGNKVVLVKTKDNIIQRTAGMWKDMKETGVEYQRRIRGGWSRRLKKQYADR